MLADVLVTMKKHEVRSWTPSHSASARRASRHMDIAMCTIPTWCARVHPVQACSGGGLQLQILYYQRAAVTQSIVLSQPSHHLDHLTSIPKALQVCC